MPKKEFRIDTPRGSIFTVNSKGGKTTAKLEWNEGFGREMSEQFSRKQAFVDQECIRRLYSYF